MPKPRKLRVDSVRMLLGTSRAAMVSRGVIRFGTMCRQTIRRSLAPMARAASMNDCSRKDRTTPRVIRQYNIHRPTANTMMMLLKLEPRIYSTINAKSKRGTDMNTSTARMMMSSMIPR